MSQLYGVLGTSVGNKPDYSYPCAGSFDYQFQKKLW